MELSQRRERLIQRLRARKSRVRERLVLVEGVRAAGEALDAGARVSFAVVSAALDTSEAGRGLADRLAEIGRSGVDVIETTETALRELADTEHPQGVLLVCEEPEVSLERAARGRLLVLDAVQDPGNLGTLVRSAVAFGFDSVVCLDGTVDPWGAKAVRAAAGMTFRINVVGSDAASALAAIEAAEVPVYCASAEGSSAATLRLGPDTTFALVLGNEGAGVRDEMRAAAAAILSVDMRGSAESLNVGIAGSILMHELTRTDL